MWQPLVLWSQKNFSHLPWRKKRNLYTTLVSEIMLQQTTVPTVINFFSKFLKQYPNIKTLAKSCEEEVLQSWKGLGYYRRAKFLLKAAQEIEYTYQGQFPLEKEELLKIPGIGLYTAHALLAIGANKNFLCVDANLERVLSRIFKISTIKGPKLQQEIYTLFSQGKILSNLEKWGARSINEALMDLGREICSVQNPKCSLCPIQKKCESFQKGEVLKYPFLGTIKKKKFFELDLLRIIVRKDNKILAYKKSPKEWLAGQYEIPTFILKSEDKKLRQYPKLEENFKYTNFSSYKTGITKYNITNYILELTEKDFFKKFKDYKNWEMISIKKSLSTSSLKALAKYSPT